MNTRVYIMLIMFLLPAVIATAQSYRRHIIKWDLPAILQKEWSGAYELRFTPRKSVELKMSSQDHLQGSGNLFPGTLIVNYGEQRVDTFNNHWPDFSLVASSQSYTGANRPLPKLPPIIPANSLKVELGYRFSYSGPKGNLRFFLQPAICLIRHSHFEIQQKTELRYSYSETSFFGTFPQYRVTQSLSSYSNHQIMRLVTHWTPGMSYDAGAALWSGRRFSLEGRCGLLWQHTSPYAELNPPQALGNLQFRFGLHAGLSLGKTRNIP